MTAGQIWRRPDGLRWVEVQAAAVEPSGWCLMIPLVAVDDAPEAPPLVVTVDSECARVHLLCSVPDDDLGVADGQFSAERVMMLQAAVGALVGR